MKLNRFAWESNKTDIGFHLRILFRCAITFRSGLRIGWRYLPYHKSSFVAERWAKNEKFFVIVNFVLFFRLRCFFTMEICSICESSSNHHLRNDFIVIRVHVALPRIVVDPSPGKQILPLEEIFAEIQYWDGKIIKTRKDCFTRQLACYLICTSSLFIL